MFPIGDDNSDRTIQPITNYILIAANILVYVFLQRLDYNDAFTYAFSLVPREITTGVDLSGVQVIRDSLGNTGKIELYTSPLPVYFNFLSSMFMHGGLMHIGGNMLFLWIFGDNVENALGHIRYGIFYIVCGIAAALAQIIMGPDSVIPMLGAMFPKCRVRAVLFNFLTEVPAYVAIGIWIVYQIVVGYFSSAELGGVAYAAHVGGFIAGVASVKVFAIGRRP